MADYGGVEFRNDSPPNVREETIELDGDVRESGPVSSYPKAMIDGLTDEAKDKLRMWLDEWLQELESSHQAKIKQFADEEEAYRAKSEGPKTYPFEGACGDVVPLVPMAVDPIFARLDVGLFKTDRIFRFKALKKQWIDYVDVLERFVDYYFRHQVKFRRIAQPRMLEMTKHGTMIFKTVYDDDFQEIMTYDKSWKPIKKKMTNFRGPRPVGVNINNFMFPARYQHLQDCPCVIEKIVTTIDQLHVMEAAGKLVNVKEIENQEIIYSDALTREREDSATNKRGNLALRDIVVYEFWCDYDINDDKIPERLVVTYHKETRTILQCRYNWYFHQRKPYTVIPYQITNDSLWGLGLCEMIYPFQLSATSWHRIATDNAYLANIRMFIAKKDAGIEDAPRLYSGRVFKVEDPTKDFIPFASSDIYNSTLQERQNIIGLVEKRTGVSDYLTGRESPIVGSRATATSTLALIKEGTQRVEEVLENIREGFSEIVMNCMFIWFQYGLDGLDDLVFSEDDVTKLKDFFDTIDAENIHGAIAVDISATDAANNQTIKQQIQMALIQTMMGYYDKLIEGGQAALQAAQTMPALTQMIADTMTSARRLFKDLLTAYNITNPEDYLPELDTYLDEAIAAAGAGGAPPGQPDLSAGAPQQPGVQPVPQQAPGGPQLDAPVPGMPGGGAPHMAGSR